MLGLLRSSQAQDNMSDKGTKGKPVVSLSHGNSTSNGNTIPSPVDSEGSDHVLEHHDQKNTSGGGPQKATVQMTIKSNQQSFTNSSMASPPVTPTQSSHYNTRNSANYSSSMMANVARSQRNSISLSNTSSIHEQHLLILDSVRRQLGVDLINPQSLDTSFEVLLEWIRVERLTRLPQKGSPWDRVLIAAQFFAEQIYDFHTHIREFTGDVSASTNMVFGQCLLLLELGSDNAIALEKVFNQFYKFGLEFAPILHHADIFSASDSIVQLLSQAFVHLLQIVSSVAISSYQQAHSSTRKTTKFDIFSRFGVIIDTFRTQVRKCMYEMWAITLRSASRQESEIEEYLQWLQPADSVLAFLADVKLSLKEEAAPLTCGWIQGELNSFFDHEEGDSTQNVMIVAGPEGCGKTTLAQWVVDRLQRPGNRKPTIVVNHHLVQDSSLPMLRSILFQLLSLRIGDVNLYEAVRQAYHDSRDAKTTEAITAIHWKALSAILKGVKDHDEHPLTILIDGLTNETSSTDQQTLIRLANLAGPSVRMMLFTQTSATPLPSIPARKISMSPQNTHDDQRALVRSELFNPNAETMKPDEEELLLAKLVVASKGNMMWLYLICQYVKLQQKDSNIQDTVRTVLADTGDSVTNIVKSLLSELAIDTNSKTALSLLIAARRPLRVRELQALLRTDVQQYTTTEKNVDIDKLLSILAPFVFVDHGLVVLRHHMIEKALIQETPVSVPDSHRDLLTRLLVNVKYNLNDESDPTFVTMEKDQVEDILQSYTVLEYATRYWIGHLKQTTPTLKAESGDVHLPEDSNKFFPNNIVFPLIEQNCWQAMYPAQELFDMHTLTVTIRTKVFGHEHPTVLQSMLFCAVLSEATLSQPERAVDWYNRSATIASKLFGPKHVIVVTCCEHIVRMTDSYTFNKTRTTTATYRETALKMLIMANKLVYGETSPQVQEVYQKLCDLYIMINEEQKMGTKSVGKDTGTDFTADQNGTDTSMSQQLEVVLKRRKEATEVDILDGTLFGGYQKETAHAMNLTRVDQAMQRAVEFEKSSEFERAEQIYLELWVRLSEQCQTVKLVDWDERKVAVMRGYANVLQAQKRTAESTTVLLSIWNDYAQSTHVLSENIVAQLEHVGLSLQQAGIHTVALQVLRRCWSFYKSDVQKHSTVIRRLEQVISETSSQMAKATMTTAQSTMSTTMLKEVLESSFTSTHHESQDNSTVVMLTRSLSDLYCRQERWSEAATVIQNTLVRSWPSFFYGQDITVNTQFTIQCVPLALQLAACYIHIKKYERAEEIYMRLYRITRMDSTVDHPDVVKYINLLETFYLKYKLYTKLITFYQELLTDYRAFYGPAHKTTIKILYALGDTCRQHPYNYRYWLEYYLEIVSTLGKDPKKPHEDTLRASVIIAEHYYETFRYFECLVHYNAIFTLFKQGVKAEPFAKLDGVQTLVNHYIFTLQESQVKYQEQYTVLNELREACIKTYQESSAIVASLTVVLADVCSRMTQHQSEAMTLYQHFLKYSSSFSSDVVQRSQTSLSTIYAKEMTSKQSSTSQVNVDQAISFVKTRYDELRKSNACTSSVVLDQLEQLVTLYQRQKKMDLVVSELHNILLESIASESSSQALMETGKRVATIYNAMSLQKQGIETITQIRRSVIFKVDIKAQRSSLDVTKYGPECFALIASFEFYLRADPKLNLEMFIADLFAQSTYYNLVIKSISAKDTVRKVTMCAAKLRGALLRTHHLQDFEVVNGQVITYFCENEPWVDAKDTNTVTGFVKMLLKHFSTETAVRSWTSSAGHAAIVELQQLFQQHKYKDALDLASCAYRFLSSHDGLSDPSDIALGFQICLMMAGRGQYKHDKIDAQLQQQMLALSRVILNSTFDICKQHNIDIARCQLSELNDLVLLISEQEDYTRLQWLLQTLWSTRECQSTWPQEISLELGKRLVQVQFTLKETMAAISLCEDIVYNVKRVHGPKHHYTFDLRSLLARMYTSVALQHQLDASAQQTSNKEEHKHLAEAYFIKAIATHEDILRLLTEKDLRASKDSAEHDDDLQSVYTTANSVISLSNSVETMPFQSREQEIMYAKRHLRALQLGLQRLGKYNRSKEFYETLTQKVWQQYGSEMNAKEEQALSSKWKMDGFGSGKSEGKLEEDTFVKPQSWNIMNL